MAKEKKFNQERNTKNNRGIKKDGGNQKPWDHRDFVHNQRGINQNRNNDKKNAPNSIKDYEYNQRSKNTANSLINPPVNTIMPAKQIKIPKPEQI